MGSPSWSTIADVATGGKVGTAKAVKEGDYYRAARAGGTLGGSEAYKKWTDPDKASASDAEDAMRRAAEEEYGAKKGVSEQMTQSEKDYANSLQQHNAAYQQNREGQDKLSDAADSQWSDSIQGSEAKFQGDVDKLSQQAEGQAQDARQTYSNTILPAFKNTMEDAQRQSQDAMSLKDAGNMNNSVMQGVRQQYETEAQGEGRQGLADVGVMQALGAQAYGGQLGQGGPMTGSQMQLAMGQQGQQAGQAFANTQRRIQGLRDQGREQAMAMSNAQYQRGERAKDRETSAIRGYESAGGRGREEQTGYRGEQGQYSQAGRGSREHGANVKREGTMSQTNRAMDRYGQKYNMDTGVIGLQQQMAQAQGLRNMDLQAGRYGDQRNQAYQDMLKAQGSLAGKNAMVGGMIGAAGTISGAAFGGPAGAAVGSQIGGSVGAGMSGGQAPQMGNIPSQTSWGQPQAAPQQQQGVANNMMGYEQQPGFVGPRRQQQQVAQR